MNMDRDAFKRPVAIGVLFLLTGVLILGLNFGRTKELEAKSTTIPATLAQLDDELLKVFVDHVGLEPLQIEVLESARREGFISVSYNMDYPERIFMDGFQSTVNTNLRTNYSFHCNYELVADEWVPYDWSWTADPELNLPVGTYRAVAPDGYFYDVEVSYRTTNGNYAYGVYDTAYLTFGFYDPTSRLVYRTDPIDFEMVDVDEKNQTARFHYMIDGTMLVLEVGYDGTVLNLDGLPLEMVSTKSI